MKRKLKTWEQFEAEFKPVSDLWEKCAKGWLWHESWFEPEFEPIEFLSKEEMKIR